MTEHASPGPGTGGDGLPRCPWAETDPLLRAYHDEEWGVPVHGEAALFERLCLEGFQSGLSWLVVLRKRDALRRAFSGFDPDRVAAFTPADVERLMGDASIIRNRRKIEAAVANARAVVALRRDGGLEGLLSRYATPDAPAPRTPDEVPSQTDASRALAKELKTRGFTFVGPVTMHATMEAVGLVDPHLAGCHRRGAATATS